MKKVSIIILNWNGREMLQTFLPSVIEHSPEELADIIVADNGSTDNSLAFLKENFPSVAIMKFDRNHGFAAGYNLAMKDIATPYSVLLNNDVEVGPKWLEPLLELLDTCADIACVQPKVRSWKNPDYFEYAGAAGGYIDRFGYPFCRGRLFGFVERDCGQYDNLADIVWATGACLFVRTNVYRNEGGLDEYFFAHQEEVDFCWRLRCRGYRIACEPASYVLHKGGATLDVANPRKTFLNFRNNLLMVYKNVPSEDLKYVLFVRFWLDIFAALKFFLEGNWGDAAAVFSARRAFSSVKNDYKTVRKKNLQRAVCSQAPGIFRRSILWEFYVLGKKTFNRLKV
ncbi:MAG: glycosyltransferase family 2 protein [Tannerellaceae bacterium]|jgi:GT2 family glycosyltransferase|nr:glycosyltransferase family 2 protein [Tannerellaceae bacterium]